VGDMPVDATSCTESEDTNRISELTGKSEVSVVILYTDPVIAAGLTAVLQKHAGFKIVPTQEAGATLCALHLPRT
jgi:hypothetical protein